MLRPAELAGHWYPSSSEECTTLLAGWPSLYDEPEPALGAIVPHGGWSFAGRISGGVLKGLASKAQADLIVVFGGHLEPGETTRVFIEGEWDTPLGPVPTPTSLAESVAMLVSAEPETAEEYYDDNAIEVLMPMFRWLWPDVPVLVLGIPPDVDALAHASEVAQQVRAHKYQAVRVVGSVDFTHYGPDYSFRPRGQARVAHPWALESNDGPLLEAMRTLDARRIAWESPRLRNTCAPGAAAAAVSLVKKLGAHKGIEVAHSSTWQETGYPEGMHSFITYGGVVFV